MTKIVGILNITPDSFFDGGEYDEEKKALKQLEVLLNYGADVIDIGAESTRPNAQYISPDQEWSRLKNILPKAIKMILEHNDKNHKNIQTSLDSRNPQNVAKALILGVDIINDVSGFEEKEMIDLAALSGKKIILMHNLGVPADKNKIVDENLDVVEVLIDWVSLKIDLLQKYGIKKENIIFDVGIGFGKNSNQSIKILKEIDRLRTIGLPLYIGHSNKSFLDKWVIDNCDSREEKTISVSSYLMSKNIEYLRIHDVESHHELRNKIPS
ncbi:MAG: dihydropteroate synthase [Myxococcota bacterium]|jgi:dihydropteroate synthase